jgi:hypothetical protein
MFLPDTNVTSMENPENLNPVLQRCMAVLRGNTAGEELRAAAERLLASGGVPTRGRTQRQGGVAMTRPVAQAGPSTQAEEAPAGSWTCSVCTLENPGATGCCSACGAGLRTGQAADKKGAVWVCSRCTLENGAQRAQCTACGQKRPLAKRLPPAAPAWASPDDDDDDAFAVPTAKRPASR